MCQRPCAKSWQLKRRSKYELDHWEASPRLHRTADYAARGEAQKTLGVGMELTIVK